MTYSLYFYRADGSLKLTTNFFVGEDEVFSDALADALYIEQELYPLRRNWREELARSGETVFTYCGTEFVRVNNYGALSIHVYDL